MINTIFPELNKILISSNNDWMKMINEFKYAKEFIDDLSTLTFGRDMQVVRSDIEINPVHTNEILLSVHQTLQSIILCLQYGNVADAHILLRKLRDDLFFYLYIIVSCQDKDLLSSEALSKQEKYINKWLKNELSKLNIKEIITDVINTDRCINLTKKYPLNDELMNIGKTLNNYTHGNGGLYYNRPYRHYTEKELHALSSEMTYMLNYILTSFVFLLILLCPAYISSTDYTDFLDFCMSPVENSQYWVAPFVTDFLEKHKDLLGENALDFLRSETPMDI